MNATTIIYPTKDVDVRNVFAVNMNATKIIYPQKKIPVSGMNFE